MQHYLLTLFNMEQQKPKGAQAKEVPSGKLHPKAQEKPQQQQQMQQNSASKVRGATLQSTLKEILGQRADPGSLQAKPSANQSALLDRLVFELSQSLTNQNTISYSRDKSFTTDTTENSKLILPGGITSAIGPGELSHDTGRAILSHGDSSSYEDCSSSQSACSCPNCFDGQSNESETEQEIPEKNKPEIMPKVKEESKQIDPKNRRLDETNRKINEMSDDVFGELVAYSYLAGLASAQSQNPEKESNESKDEQKNEIDGLNDTQFIERSLLQYEKWQQSFLNNTLVHGPKNEEICVQQEPEEEEMRAIAEAARIEAEMAKNQQQIQLDEVVFQEYYKQLLTKQKPDEKKPEYDDQLGEQLYEIFVKQKASQMGLKNVPQNPCKVVKPEIDMGEDEPIPPENSETQDAIILAPLQNKEFSAVQSIGLSRSKNDDLYKPTEFESYQNSEGTYPFEQLEKQFLSSQTGPVSFDVASNPIPVQKESIMHHTTSNFAGALGCSNEQEIRELMRDLVPQTRSIIDDSSSVFTTTSLEEANFLDHSMQLKPSTFLEMPEQEQKVSRKECVCGFQDDQESIFDQEKRFMESKDLKMMLDVERNLYRMLQYSSEDDLTQAKADSDGDDEPRFSPSVAEVDAIAGLSLKQLETFMIQGDLRRCVCCNAQYTTGVKEGTKANLPRVLFCGDVICEQCIIKHTQKASMTKDKKDNGAACQLVCPVCNFKHVFKLTKSGFLVANDNYIKFLDERGPVNFFPGSKISEQTSIKMLTDNLKNSDGSLMLMDPSISIPNNLVLRSLPINQELCELLETERNCGEPCQSTAQLRGLFHVVLDGNQPTEQPVSKPGPPENSQKKQEASFERASAAFREQNRRNLKELQKTQRKQKTSVLEQSVREENFEPKKQIKPAPLFPSFLQRIDGELETVQIALDQEALQKKEPLEQMPKEAIQTIADWFLQSKGAILNKRSIKEPSLESESSENKRSGNTALKDCYSEQSNQVAKVRRRTPFADSLHLSSQSSKSTIKRNKHMFSPQESRLEQVDSLLAASQVSFQSHQHQDKIQPSLLSLLTAQRKRKRRVRRLKKDSASDSPQQEIFKEKSPLMLLDQGEMSADSDWEGNDDTIDFGIRPKINLSEKEELNQDSDDQENEIEPQTPPIDEYPPPAKQPSVSDLLQSSFQGSDYIIEDEKLLAKHDAMRQLMIQNEHKAKDQHQPIFCTAKGIQVVERHMSQKSEAERRVMLQNLGNDELLDLLSNTFGIDKATLRLEWERFEREAEELAEENERLLEEFRPGVNQVKSLSESPQYMKENDLESVDTFEDSASKKKARRNKKKRKKQQLQEETKPTEAQLLATLEEQGTQIDEKNESDMFTSLVLQGEETIEENDLRYRTVARDYFNYKPLSQENYAAEVFLTLEEQVSSSEQAIKAEEKDALSSLKLPLTCMYCSEGTPVQSTNGRAEIVQGEEGQATLIYGKQDLALIKEMVEVGITSIATHVCLYCSFKKHYPCQNMKSDPNLKWKNLPLPEDFACTLCLVCAVHHKQLNVRVTQEAEDLLLTVPQVIAQDNKLHQLSAVLPFSHFQLLQKQIQKGSLAFTLMLEHACTNYFSRVTDEDYLMFMIVLCARLQIGLPATCKKLLHELCGTPEDGQQQNEEKGQEKAEQPIIKKKKKQSQQRTKAIKK